MIFPEKDYRSWMRVKRKLHNTQSAPKISDHEIWWCGFGENVGVEIDGKHAAYSRPVYIFKKLGAYSFLGIPLTSKNKVGSWYVSFSFQGRKETAVLAQARAMSVSRLYDRMGRLDDADATKIKDGFARLFLE